MTISRNPLIWSLFAVMALSLVPADDVEAGQVVWSSDRVAKNVTSAGTDLGAGFRFELGGFVAGFVPTAANVGEWRAHWVVVATAEYHTEVAFFAASTVIEELPAGIDGAAYIWGLNQEAAAPGAEWILLSNPDWILPAGGPDIAPPAQWSTGTATVVIVGSVNAVPGIHLQTTAVDSMMSHTASAWLASSGLGGVDESQVWESDLDGDGVSTLLEYASGTDPLSAASVSRVVVSLGTYEDGVALTLTFDKNPLARVNYQIETSSDLERWEPADDAVVLLSATADRVTVRAARTLAAADFRYLRVRVGLLP